LQVASEKNARSKPRTAESTVTLKIDSHRALLAKRKDIIGALVADPTRAKLLFANASLAFKDSGVELSPAISNHVLHTVRQSKAATTRREQLTAQLREALGVVPKPSDASWLAKTLFTTLKLTPLDTKGHQPTYQPSIPLPVQEKLRTHLVPSTRPRLPARKSSTEAKELPWRLDLDADVPSLGKARAAPKSVSLEDLWFYLDSHEVIRPLLELGILERSVLPTLTREQYEAVKAGRPTGGFIDWIDTVTFPEDRIRPQRPVAKDAPAEKPAKKPVAKKAPAKKAPANKASAKKAPAKKAPAKKAPANKAPANRASAKKSTRRKPA
jgi:hypothetical protein